MSIVLNGTSGITSPEVTLDNTNADGGQVVLKSSGYNNWNLDNYSGNLRAYYNATEYMRIDSSGNLQFNSGYGSVATSYGCRAWVNFNGTGTVAIRGSGNVTSITDQGTGTYTINFTNAMPDSNYSGLITSGFASGIREDILGFAYTDAPYAPATGSYTVKFVRADTNAAVDTNFAMVAIFR